MLLSYYDITFSWPPIYITFHRPTRLPLNAVYSYIASLNWSSVLESRMKYSWPAGTIITRRSSPEPGNHAMIAFGVRFVTLKMNLCSCGIVKGAGLSVGPILYSHQVSNRVMGEHFRMMYGGIDARQMWVLLNFWCPVVGARRGAYGQIGTCRY